MQHQNKKLLIHANIKIVCAFLHNNIAYQSVNGTH